MKYALLIILSCLLTLKASSQLNVQKEFNSTQLIVVTTGGWNSTNGKLGLYNYEKGIWKPVLKDINIITGYSGMAWGDGLHHKKFNKGKLKIEGDGNTPAGIFTLDGLFGYEHIVSEMKSLKVDVNTFCVDDISSLYYNKIVHSDTVKKDWNSAETMRLNSDAYKYGIFVGYNTNPVVKGKGSCIFFHITEGGKATSGCTAMNEKDILKLMENLDPKRHPLVVEAPLKEYNILKKEYKLP